MSQSSPSIFENSEWPEEESTTGQMSTTSSLVSDDQVVTEFLEALFGPEEDHVHYPVAAPVATATLDELWKSLEQGGPVREEFTGGQEVGNAVIENDVMFSTGELPISQSRPEPEPAVNEGFDASMKSVKTTSIGNIKIDMAMGKNTKKEGEDFHIICGKPVTFIIRVKDEALRGILNEKPFYVRAFLVRSTPEAAEFAIEACPKHVDKEIPGHPLVAKEHENVQYLHDPPPDGSNRRSILFTGLKLDGSNNIMIKLMNTCYNSCHRVSKDGLKRQIVFSIENMEGKLLGRKAQSIKSMSVFRREGYYGEMRQRQAESLGTFQHRDASHSWPRPGTSRQTEDNLEPHTEPKRRKPNPPNESTVVPPNVSTVVPPDVSTVVSPNVPTVVPSNVSTVVPPNVSTVVPPNVSTVVPPSVSAEVLLNESTVMIGFPRPPGMSTETLDQNIEAMHHVWKKITEFDWSLVNIE